MNNRISELINKAARQFEKEASKDVTCVYYDRAMEIFAELIIKECLNICSDVCDSANDPEWRIVEHFGMDHDWRNVDNNVLCLDIEFAIKEVKEIAKKRCEELQPTGESIFDQTTAKSKEDLIKEGWEPIDPSSPLPILYVKRDDFGIVTAYIAKIEDDTEREG